MKINVFEGARRLTKIAIGVVFIMAVMATVMNWEVHQKGSMDDYYAYAFLWLVICPLTVWIISSLIGWTVRGFMGIPRGQDSK